MTVIGFRSVIQYSWNPIWPRLIFFILSCWCWLSHTMLMNSNNVWIWDVIQICKIFARIWQFSFFTLDVLGPKHKLAPKQCKGKLVGWLVGCFDDLRRFSDISAISRLGCGDKQSLNRRGETGNRTRTSCSADQELNHYTTAVP